jgi:hypothetical protein
MRRKGLVAIAFGAFAGCVLTAWAARSQLPQRPVLTTRLDEQNPAAGGGYIAWSRNSRARRRHFDAYVRQGRGRTIRLNARGTQGWIGGISGTTLVYQQAVRNRSDLKLFDLARRTRSNPPPGFNTRSWEWHPTVSGEWILFARSSEDADYMILRSLATGRQLVLDTLTDTSGDAQLEPGQVNGNFAVWTKCVSRTECIVFRYGLAQGTKTGFEAPRGKLHYGASVTAAGTVYLARSGRSCGNRVELWRYPLDGPPSLLLRFRRGQDFRFSYAVTLPQQRETAVTEVYYDRVRCARKSWDIYKVVDVTRAPPPPPQRGRATSTSS